MWNMNSYCIRQCNMTRECFSEGLTDGIQEVAWVELVQFWFECFNCNDDGDEKGKAGYRMTMDCMKSMNVIVS